MKEKKSFRLKSRAAVLAALIILVVLAILFFALRSSYYAVINENDAEYYKAKSIVIIGNTLFCLKDSTVHKSRRGITNDRDGSYTPAFISMDNVKFIEILRVEEKPVEKTASPVAFHKCLGRYRINVSGHRGYLYLAFKNKRFYGLIKFPHWANGVNERLKNLWIRNGKIRFVRSVTSARELKRVGASTYFTQKYYGTCSKDGTVIKGTYTGGRGESVWEAKKIK